MKHTKILVLALLVALLACLVVSANAATHEGSHIWEEIVENYVAPGCETRGYRYYRCSVAGCGETRIDYIEALGHKWGAFEQVKPATCGAPGIQQQKCERCSHYNTEILYAPAATGAHDFSVKVKDAFAATCTTDGWKALYKCSICGAVDPARNGSAVKASGHNTQGSAWYAVYDPTCYSEGLIAQDCYWCGARVNTKKVPKNGVHPDGFQKVLPSKPATCTSTGCCELWQCPYCGAVDKSVHLDLPGNYADGRAIPALGHKWGAPATVPATCTNAGYTTVTCERCNHIQKIDIPATGHSATWQIKDASNSPTSVIWTLKCGICGTELATQIVYKGEKAPSGTVETGKAKVDVNYSANVKKVTETAKKSTTKKTTAKKTTTTKATTTTTKQTALAVAAAEGTKLVAGINNLEDKAVVVVKDGKATLVYAEADVIVKIGETVLEANVPVDVAADATATVAAADAAATK